MASDESAAVFQNPSGSWFHEVSPLWPGQAFGLEVSEVLFQGKSDYQDVIIFQSKSYGRVLVLDGAIQLTERDQFAYQEMISHIPVHIHPNPKKVLVIGGGDGAVLTQLIKHKDIESIVLCEIDQMVIDQSKKFFPQFLPGWTDPRVSVVVKDGFQYLKDNLNTFDVILVDSSDPNEGPAETLFTKDFFSLLHGALTESGVICTQAECIWLHLEFIGKLLRIVKELFPTVGYAHTLAPTYPSGTIGFCVASKSSSVNLNQAKRTPTESMDEEAVKSLQYYSNEIHTSAFVLPPFAAKVLSTPQE
eukprot:CAMPEP_0201475522 /NCGR_PEP_ID=MMETSP0151_2-20130828/939_1 /ASSEMBLY_ACC=CAM_ASM_000257 /TAXON_ID=200890 /ORGANISM="Paramoeba atlantica, Strain 621/1 / CCAP 1560/9" /LENGTH=303 /DNA_ID=CAMNT_0047855637 /DNA_START=65 /DNA_END=976 /DNA_ORIENTATION=+